MQGSNILVFDTETTGLPPRKSPVSDIAAWERCRMVEIAWSIYTPCGDLLDSSSFLIRPDRFVIPASATAIHNISHQMACRDGVHILQALDSLHEDLVGFGIGRIVAHNIEFDIQVLESELHRYGRYDILQTLGGITDRFCTMRNAYPPRVKWPRLKDLYTRLFGEPGDGVILHRAGADVTLCSHIYFRLQEVGYPLHNHTM